MRDARSGGLPLSSFLLKPVQRVTRYHMLLKKILDFTPTDHFDFDDLQDAHAKATQLAEQVNEGVEQRENSERLEWLQQHVDMTGLNMTEKLTFNSLTNCVGPRRLLFHGCIAKVKSPSKPVWTFLFNDILLVTKPLGRGVLSNSTIFSNDEPKGNEVKLRVAGGQPFLLDSLGAKPSEQANDFIVTFKEPQGGLRVLFDFRCRTSVERNNWVKNINEAVGQYLPRQHQSRLKRSLSQHRSAAVGRLQLSIVGARELPLARPPKKPDSFCVATLGEQENRTRVIQGTSSPEWNEPLQFMLKNLETDVLCLTVYDRDLYSPNGKYFQTVLFVYFVVFLFL